MARNVLATYLIDLRRAARGQEHIARETVIQLGHSAAFVGISRADDDARGLEEVVNRAALLQELRVGNHDRLRVALGCDAAEDGLEYVARADRRGGLVDNHGAGAVERYRHRLSSRAEVAQVRAPPSVCGVSTARKMNSASGMACS